MADEERPEIPPEDLLEAIRKMKVSDLLLSTVSTTAQLGYAKLEPDSRDLEQARLAIESTKALLPLLEGRGRQRECSASSTSSSPTSSWPTRRPLQRSPTATRLRDTSSQIGRSAYWRFRLDLPRIDPNMGGSFRTVRLFADRAH